MKAELRIALTIAAATLGIVGSVLSLRAALGSGAEPRLRELGPAEIGARSVYHLGSTWTSEDERSVRLIDLGGQFVVVAMIFTSCPSACPTLVTDLQAIDRRLPERVRHSTRFLLVSIDPERDTPAVMREYAARLGLSKERFVLLCGSVEAVRELSAVLGFSYRKAPGEPLSHSRLVTVLDRRGEVIHQQAGVREDPEKLIAVIDAALSKEAAP